MFQNRFVHFNLQPEENLLIETWTKDTTQMKPFEWKDIHLELVETVEKYQPSKLLVHSEVFDFPITPDLQDWLAQHVFPKVAKAGLRKIAFVIASDLFAQVSIEQLMNEDKEQNFITGYFPSEKEAKNWLFEN